MRAFLACLRTSLDFLRARLAEPSTHAGLAAFLAAAAAGADLVDSPRTAAILLGSAALAGVKAMLTADPAKAVRVEQALTIGRVAVPMLAGMAEAVLPEHAARIAALEGQVAAIADKLAPAER